MRRGAPASACWPSSLMSCRLAICRRDLPLPYRSCRWTADPSPWCAWAHHASHPSKPRTLSPICLRPRPARGRDLALGVRVSERKILLPLSNRTRMTDPALSNDCFSRDALEFPGILELVRGFLSGPITEPLLHALEPRTDLEGIRRDNELTREACEYLREGSRPSVGSLKDPRPVLDRLAIEGES